MEEVLKELAYFKGITYYTSQFCGSVDDAPETCIRTNLSYYANMVSFEGNRFEELHACL